MAYHCYLIDDEPIAIDVIRAHLERLDQLEIAGTFQDPVKAFQAIRQEPVDLLFLDIEMPDLNGLELIRSLPDPPDVILTTAHREFALEGFELDVVDYLLKPIPFDRFLQAVGKFLDKHRIPTASTSTVADHLFVRADRKSVRIDFNRILFVEGVKDYVKIVLDSRKILTKESIGKMAERLPADQFLRIHRSFIVNCNKITAYTATEVEIERRVLPIGRVFRKEFLEKMERSC